MVRSQREIFRRMDFRGRTEMRLFPGHTGLQSMGDGAGLSVTKGQHMMVCVRERFVSANQGLSRDKNDNRASVIIITGIECPKKKA